MPARQPTGRHLARTRQRGSMVAIVLVTALFAVVAVGLLAYFVSRRTGGGTAKHLTAVVEEKDFVNDVVESGEVESSENVEVRCEVKSRNGTGTIILDVVPEGSFVRGPYVNDEGEEVPGDILLTLDASGLNSEKQQEDIILNNKIALRDQALNVLIAAISALKEYVGQEEFEQRFLDELTTKLGNDAEEVLSAIAATTGAGSKKGTFHVEEQGFQAELFLAEENFRKAQQYFRYSESLAAQGYVTELQLKSDEFAVEKARKDRDAAQTKLDVLRIHTKKKTEKALTGDIYNALSVYRAEKNSVQVQEERVDEITTQIAKCILRAPQDGQVVYANERDRRGNSDFVVEPGVTVRERQVLIRLPDSNKMQVEAKISESKISFVKQGMKATVSIDAFDDMELDGIVTRVNQYPEPTSWFSSTVKEYVTLVQILNPPRELKSGLTAKVRIHAQHVPDARQVPIQSIYRHKGKYFCFVKEAGGWKAKQVSLGASNEKHVVVKDGVQPGEEISMDPASLLEEVELPQITLTPDEQLAAGNGLADRYVNAGTDSESATTTGADGGESTGENNAPRSGPPGGMNPAGGMPDPATIVATMFASGDANKDGKLTQDEIPERFRGNFSQTDTNGDGGIDRAEMTAALAKRFQNRENAQGSGRPETSGAGE